MVSSSSETSSTTAILKDQGEARCSDGGIEVPL